MKKRLLSLALIFALCIGLVPAALAAGGQEFVIENGVLTKYNGPGGQVIIPSGVTELGRGLFFRNEKVTSVIVPEGVTCISGQAMAFMSNLQSVALPGTLTKIEGNAFEESPSLTSITIPVSVETIGAGAFYNCTSLRNITLGNPKAIIYNRVFEGTAWMKAQVSDFAVLNGVIIHYQGSDKHAVVPASAANMAYGAFQNCTTLEKVTFPVSGPLVEKLKGWRINLITNLFYGSSSVNEIINCPNEKLALNMEKNRGALAGWINPGQNVFTPKNEEFIRLSDQITAGLTSNYEKAEAIVQWLDENITYDITTEGSSKNTAELVMQHRTAVCEGYANLCRFLMSAQGIPCKVVTGYADLSKSGMHAWNICFIDGRWIWVEPQGEFDIPFVELCRSYRVLEPFKTTEQNIPSNWAKDTVWETICASFTPFDLQKEYRSDITREEFCRLMIKLVEQKSGMGIDAYLRSLSISRQNVFTDTSSPDVQAAYALGIISGTSATTFGPNLPITRQEAAVMLSRAGKLLNLTARNRQVFADAKDFASWASEGITYVQRGIGCTG